MKLNKFTLTGVVAASLGAMMMTMTPEASAAKRDISQRWFNPISHQWEFGPRPAKRRLFSNKSPIPKRRVRIDKKYSPNTIIIDTSERRLYYVTKRGKALKYGVGVGRDGFQWTGTHKVTRKAEWPSWSPPREMIKRVKRQTGKTLKSYYAGGPSNPMGARALYIGSTIYRIHGTTEPWSIGQAMSSGCIRLANDDVTDLYQRVQVGAQVIVKQ